jgi:hypothetical protein
MGLPCTVQVEDIHVRLPTTERTYEEGSPSDMLIFDSHQPLMVVTHIEEGSNVPSPATYTIVIAVLWTLAAKLLSGPSRRLADPNSRPNDYESTVYDIQARLLEWRSSLPPHLNHSRQALTKAIRCGYAGSLISMHTLYHMTQFKFARHTYHEHLSPSTIARHIQIAHTHAFAFLEIVCDLGSQIGSTGSAGSEGVSQQISAWSSFIVSSTLTAIDTISAGGLRQNIKSTMMTLEKSVLSLCNFARFHTITGSQIRRMRERVAQIEVWVVKRLNASAFDIDSLATSGEENESYWTIEEPMEKRYSLQQDIIYGTSPSVYFLALSR